jgi:hypothetical protein
VEGLDAVGLFQKAGTGRSSSALSGMKRENKHPVTVTVTVTVIVIVTVTVTATVTVSMYVSANTF